MNWNSLVKRMVKRDSDHYDLRLATIQDLEEVTMLTFAAVEEMEGGIEAPNKLADDVRTSIEGDTLTFLVELNGSPVGMVNCRVMQPYPWQSGDSLVVWMLYVLPEHRRSPGAITTLISAIWGLAEEANVSRVVIASDPDSPYMEHYRRMGFRPFAMTLIHDEISHEAFGFRTHE